MKKGKLIYVLTLLIIASSMSLGMLILGSSTSSENRSLAQAPQLIKDGTFNEEILSDAGSYFEDHFAFRNQLVTAYDLILAKVFATSGQSGVIMGSDGWLYYKDSLEDYQGENQMTDRALFNVVHSLRMVQDYAKARDINFAFVIAPNKNELYPENMPYYYKENRETENNFSRIRDYLESEGVNYADAYEAIKEASEINKASDKAHYSFYHKTDSHWDNRGAAIAADQILTAVGREHKDYSKETYVWKDDFAGDLAAMLYPSLKVTEEEAYYDPAPAFEYVTEVSSNFDPKIETKSEAADGSLVMYRDSFGNALLPFMAEAYSSAYFSRGVPYNLTDLDTYQANALVIERAERFLPDMAANPPMMCAEAIQESELPAGLSFTVCEGADYSEMGDYIQLTGSLPEQEIAVDARIYIRTDSGKIYEAFPLTSTDGSEGFSLRLPAEDIKEASSIEIAIASSGNS